ncbi:3-hydroxyisobutyryl-CoA hydrolase, mitochondrial-like [Varroa jacobsoni]|uniref:3-hydroxyisobutyryl-CoA hydrolase, mitochondrial-like n=1 Tax=Varroa jacobsoni TaxID=62625 RepID=UPI000BF9131B|nr:3-hydroxyisobutyryl-CoA hydrolase, mitochondrial-like [Varroa jacobsoni]XP_022708831.1 3-hydroxyisobutyryl-CoA hydrolase, mitochondrial-like [Varroa jacobsoni]XP_022708832.1 3-hydroxyisobutyryl-CoA hydrolase, mitochondrial-like [Varroa jacobsoni]XP_022708833.1 3-hydroxyisobutyryl-CoA hydrolase, mitochondrial-like [Varroa jacobsoni]
MLHVSRVSFTHAYRRTMTSSALTGDAPSDVLLKLVGRKGVITMNRPNALNALSLSMIRVMEPVVRKWHNDNLADLVVLRACEGKAFCAGGDVKAVAANKENNDIFFREEYVLDYLLAKMRPTLVSFIDGIVMGGGCGISFHGRFSIVSENALFAMPETAIGLFPDVGACHFLSRMKHNLGVFFGLTGNRIKGADLVHAGLVSNFVPSEKFKQLEKDIMNLNDCSEGVIDTAILAYQAPTGKFSLESHLSEIENCFGANTVEEIVAKLKKTGSDFSKKQLDIMSKMSPLSMKITLEAIRKAKMMSLAEVLQMDMRLGARFLRDNDFYEGVNALLVRKTKDPKWKPATLEECTPEIVDKYFLKLPPAEELRLEI